MLETNTDRSFWMVGAIIVGAALILIAKVIFPGVLNSLGGWFGKLISDTTKKSLATSVAPILPAVSEAATHVAQVASQLTIL